MHRFALRVEYDGAPFSGWQRQDHAPSVQGALEDALAQIDPGPHAVAAAGRTDAGVHAAGQVAAATLARPWDPFRLSEALNHHLRPLPVAVTAAAPAAEGWHPRFDAVAREYLYTILNRRAPDTLTRNATWHVRHALDADAMARAAAHFRGRHDWTTFRAAQCQADGPLRTVDEATVTRTGERIVFRVRARSFLHSQVRSMVGSLERVGAGAWTPGELRDALLAADRARCGPVAPPGGLVLAAVRYPRDPFA
ncbi:tRNA pseudouridine38-40 synthase [Hasllibacter halocynthiae]|uniref:tRNA pseudouridine synthase A n=1 Tax=Hasllibacter halocynthiae TaxID=595589 RepID=A0A2T0X9P9_9RHOB|nr:tRNA pseudouridine(38-40) synthase TruA [Hasllibacter halocynthiae]PRY95670.1 tRNA pseudouridine38-40 synthase [Hasllibacter halocynthiae]